MMRKKRKGVQLKPQVENGEGARAQQTALVLSPRWLQPFREGLGMRSSAMHYRWPTDWRQLTRRGKKVVRSPST